MPAIWSVRNSVRLIVTKVWGKRIAFFLSLDPFSQPLRSTQYYKNKLVKFHVTYLKPILYLLNEV